MGLPGSGKTTLANELAPKISAKVINADKIREKFNDWDFSIEGRMRQAKRMKKLSEDAVLQGDNVIADFICPTEKTREDFNADFIIWLDTIKKGRYEDTNLMFEPPKEYFLKVTTKNAIYWSNQIAQQLSKEKIKNEN